MTKKDPKISKLFDLLRKEVTPDSYSVVLPIIYLRTTNTISPNLLSNEDVKGTLIQHMKNVEEATLKEVYSFFLPFIEDLSNRTIRDIINILLSIEPEWLKENKAKFFDEALRGFVLSQGEKSGDFILPYKLTKFVNAYVGSTEGLKIFNPFAGVGSFLKDSKDSSFVYGQEIDKKTWAIGQLRLIINQVPVTFKCEDSILNWPQKEKFDLIISNPPLGLRLEGLHKEIFPQFKSSEDFLLHKSVDILSNKGKAIAFLPYGFLFKRGIYQILREKIIQEDLLDTVISFPGRLLSNTGIAFVMIILNKQKQIKGKIRLIDAEPFTFIESSKKSIIETRSLLKATQSTTETDSIRIISNKKVIDNNFNLHIGRYINEKVHDGINLSNILSLKSGKKCPKMKTYPAVKIKDLINANPYIKTSDIKDQPLKNPPSMISGEFLFVSLAGPNIEVGLSKQEEIILIQDTIKAFRINTDEADPEYIYYILKSDEVKQQIKRLSFGTALTMLRINDFLSIKIPLPSLEKQKKYVVEQLYSSIREEEKALRKLKKESGINDADDISYLRHSLAGSVKNARDSFSKVQSILDNQIFNQHPEFKSLTNKPRSKISLAEHLDIIKSDLDEIRDTVSRTSIEIDVRTMEMEHFDFIKYVKEYTNILEFNRGSEFTTRFKYDKKLLENSDIKSLYVYGNKKMLQKAFDNIIDNAVKHAFKDEENPLIELEILFDPESNNELQLDISNNGKCLPDNFSIDDLTRKGQMIGPNAGDGFGGHLIKEIIEAHKGRVDVTDESGEEGLDIYPRISTSFEIKLPFITEL